MPSAAEALAKARSQIGYLEKASNANLDSFTANAGSGNYTKYWRDLRMEGYQGQPWCDAFVKWCVEQADGDTGKAKAALCQAGREWSFYTPTSARYFWDAGRWHGADTEPKPGDQIFFKDSGGTICHTGLVEFTTAGAVTTIEGNTSGASGVIANGGGVCRKTYVRTYQRIAGYGRPMYTIDEEADMTDEQAKQLKEIYSQVTKRTDPTGRNKNLNDHDHIKWIAKEVSDTKAQVAELAAKVDKLAAKL